MEAGDPRTVADLVKPEGLKWMARFAEGIGPVVNLVIPKNPDGSPRLARPLAITLALVGLVFLYLGGASGVLG